MRRALWILMLASCGLDEHAGDYDHDREVAVLGGKSDDQLPKKAWTLLLYGAGVLVGGMFSVGIVRLGGALFMLLGFLAIATPPQFGNLWLGIGFGALQVIGGLWIARKYGG